jgi:hypothetical protein
MADKNPLESIKLTKVIAGKVFRMRSIGINKSEDNAAARTLMRDFSVRRERPSSASYYQVESRRIQVERKGIAKGGQRDTCDCGSSTPQCECQGEGVFETQWSKKQCASPERQGASQSAYKNCSELRGEETQACRVATLRGSKRENASPNEHQNQNEKNMANSERRCYPISYAERPLPTRL